MQVRLYLAAGILFLSSSLRAQEPISWTYTVKPLGNLQFEVHLLANLQDGWHIYAQHQPQEAISRPTSIHYSTNPLIVLQGPAKEDGRLIHYKIEGLNMVQDQYNHQVDFVQRIQLKASVKTHLTGSIDYQVCTDHNCMPPASQVFTLDLSPELAAK